MVKAILFAVAIIIGLSEKVSSQAATLPPNVYVDGACICVTKGYCSLSGDGGSTDGAGQIDPRIMTSGSPASPITGANNISMTPITSGLAPIVVSQTTCAVGLEVCCPPTGFSCGMVFPPVENSATPIDGQGQSKFGEYPWQVALLTLENVYIGSGVLIDHVHVLTAAHKIYGIPPPFKARIGEWDASGETEPLPAVEIQSSSIYFHPKYNSKNLQYDLAIIRLASNVPLGTMPTVTNICLPSTPLSGMRCWVSGWGKNDFVPSGQYQAIMKAVDIPLIDYSTCLRQLRATRLGQNFMLDPTSFVCAGGETAKDACTGDGGAPLACSVGGRWYLAGLVAWGIGCGQVNVPGVYVNIFNLTTWIQQTTQQSVASGLRTTVSPTTTPTTMRTTTRPAVTTPAAATTRAAATAAPTTTFTMQSTSTTGRAGSGLNTTTTSRSNSSSSTVAKNAKATPTTKTTTRTTTRATTTTKRKA